jgi:glutamate dehydrogenase (NAD(P)+)
MMELFDDWGPEKVVCVADRRVGMRGVLVIDNTARGIGKGGTRMSPFLTVREVAQLARVMTWKWAMAGLFYGGAKAGIAADPSAPGKEEVLRSFVRQLGNEIPREYVFGLDMGLTGHDAAIVQDELGSPATAVGAPFEVGGFPYDELGAAGFGVAEAVDAASSEMNIQLRGARVIIQGFGAVGSGAAKRLTELGATVVAVSTATSAVYHPDGLDVPALLELRADLGDNCLAAYSRARKLLPGEELTVPADVLVPAAREGMIDADVAAKLTVSLVVEGANMPTTADARQQLADRGVVLIPDLVANAGGAIAAAHAMDAREASAPPTVEAVFASIARIIRSSTAAVLEAARTSAKTPRACALELAQERVQAAMNAKGRTPTAARQSVVLA